MDLIPDNAAKSKEQNRAIKDATVKRYFYETHDQLRAHLQNFVDAYNFARRLKKPSGASPHTNSSAKPGLQSLRDSNSIRSSKRRDYTPNEDIGPARERGLTDSVTPSVHTRKASPRASRFESPPLHQEVRASGVVGRPSSLGSFEVLMG